MSKILLIIAGTLMMGLSWLFWEKPQPPFGAILVADSKPALNMNNKDTLEFFYTDDNTGEDLIIYTDKESYTGPGETTIYFSVQNISNKNQNVDLVFFAKGSLANIEEMVFDIPYQVSSVSQVYVDEWQKQEKNSREVVRPINAKTVKNLNQKGNITSLINSGATKYYKARLQYKPFSSKEEFFIEAIGNQGAYGNLDPYYSSGYTNRFKITIDHNQVASASATFINFPVLITASKSSTIFNELRTIANGGKASSGSGEFVFTQSDGVTTLAHEIERYTATTGDFLAWVNIPRLSSTADTILYMYYGGPSTGATNQNITGTWDTNFVGVWHLPNGTTLGALDSTSNGNNGTITETVAGTGRIDGAGNFDGTNDLVNVGSATSLDNISQGTITMWIKPTSVATFNKSLYLKRGGTNNFIFSIADTNAGDLALYYNQSTTNLVALTAGSYITTNEWQFVAGVWNSSGVNGDQHLYRGTTSAFAEASYSTQTAGSGTHDDSTVSGSIGARTNGTGPYAGIIDEVRISNTARSSDWIKTEYNNQNSPTTFASFSNDEDDLIEEE